MDAARLELVGRFLFEDRGSWCREMAGYLDVHETTVRRWVRGNRVPRVAEIALEHSFQHGLLKEVEVAR